MNTISKYLKYIGVLICLPFALVSCNEDFPNILKEDYGTTDVSVSKSKVLLVVVDGLRGNVFTDLEPENLRVISRNSLYTNNSLGDYAATSFNKSVGLANIFTGVKSASHNVSDDNLSTINLTNAPTFINRLKANYDGFSSEAYTVSNDVKNYLLKDVDQAEVLANDVEVVNKVKTSLASTESNLVVAHLNNPDLVGKASSYETSNAGYVAAANTLDKQMGELVNAINARPNVKNENWLVIFTSSVGGVIAEDLTSGDKTVFGDSKQNTFTYFYSPSFGRKYVAKPTTKTMPFQGAGMRLLYSNDGNSAMSARLEDVTKANVVGTQDYTFTFFFKQNIVGTHYNYPPIIMKRPSIDNGTTPGYQFIMSSGQVEVGYNGLGTKLKSINVTDGKWHIITLTINRAENKAKIYTDGVLSQETTAGTSNLTNNEPLVVGKHPNDGYNSGDFTVCNLQMYNKAMTATEVAQYSGLALVKSDNSPFYGNLIGYWPMYDDNGKSTLTDVTGKVGSMKIFNKSSWSTFDEYVSYITPDVNDNTYKLVPNTVDIPVFIYQWFGMIPNASWNLLGKAWTPPYKVLEY